VKVFKATSAELVVNFNDPRAVSYTIEPDASSDHGQTVISTKSFDLNTNYVFAFRAINEKGGSTWAKFDYTILASPTRNLRGARQ
jgi:hypothetical protein